MFRGPKLVIRMQQARKYTHNLQWWRFGVIFMHLITEKKLRRTDRRTNMKKIGVSATMQTSKKITCDSQGGTITRQVSVALNQWCQEAKSDLLPATRRI